MSDTYVSDPTVFEYARSVAKQKAIAQWESGNWNMWLAYNQTLNQSWVDPWNEDEVRLISNESPDWLITQNIYYCYCWLKYKGYSDYAIVGILANFVHESTCTGGAWEGSTANPTGHHPYTTLIGYDATALSENPNSYRWAIGGNPLDYASSLATWTAQWTTPAGVDYGPYTGQTWYKYADAGSWEAVKRYAIKTSRQMVDGVGMRIMPIGWETDELQFDYDQPGVQGDGRGYGLAQFTPWTKLPKIAAYISTDAPRHWQVNATLQLMIIEKQREFTANGDPYNGQWDSSGGVYAGFMVNPNGTYFEYGQNITWEDFADDTYLSWVTAKCADARITSATDIDWCKRMTACTIWQNCYEQGGHNPSDYFNMRFPEISLYILDAIHYWDIIGYDVKDIPRARDLAFTELDQYHPMPINQMLPLIVSNRRVKHVRTILL